jgi:hypothetical protein
MKHLKNAEIPYFKKIDRKPIDHLEDILNGKYQADMLIKCFQVQAFYPTQANTDVSRLMETLQIHSGWISNIKINSVEKAISKLPSIAITEVLKYSTRIQQEKMSPRPAHHFVYQKDTTVPSYDKVLKEMKNDSSYRYCTILSSQSWKEYIKDPFNDKKRGLT